MQLPGGNLDPQPQRILQTRPWLLLIDAVRANNILGVDEVLAQRVPVALEPVERHTGDSTWVGSQPRDQLGVRPTVSDAIAAPRGRPGQRGDGDARPSERIVLESPQVDREIVRRPSRTQGGSIGADLVERITAPTELAIT
jgi:hypothetical protein